MELSDAVLGIPSDGAEEAGVRDAGPVAVPVAAVGHPVEQLCREARVGPPELRPVAGRERLEERRRRPDARVGHDLLVLGSMVLRDMLVERHEGAGDGLELANPLLASCGKIELGAHVQLGQPVGHLAIKAVDGLDGVVPREPKLNCFGEVPEAIILDVDEPEVGRHFSVLPAPVQVRDVRILACARPLVKSVNLAHAAELGDRVEILRGDLV